MRIKYSKGLTLIEFLMAFTIFAVISLSIYSCFYSGMQINKRSKNFQQGLRNILWSVDAIAYDIENMVPYTFAPQDPPAHPFWGNEREFSLVVGTEQGLKQMRYFLAQPQSVKIHTTKLGTRSTKNVPLKSGQIEQGTPLNYLVRQAKAWDGSLEDELLSKYIVQDSLRISYARRLKEGLVWENQWKDADFPAGLRIAFQWVDPQTPGQVMAMEKVIVIPLGTGVKIKQ